MAVAVDNGEGCSVEAMQNTNIFIVGIVDALDLLIERTWCKATLRRLGTLVTDDVVVLHSTGRLSARAELKADFRNAF